MKKTLRLAWNGYRYFAYERDFARREVKALIGTPTTDVDGGLLIEADDVNSFYPKLHRLTYFRQVVLPDGSILVPDQAILEKSNGPSLKSHPVTTRQSTRYSAHGLHEYRGKFNPQVVRAIGNMLNLSEGAWVLDPFCGSGTTLLECAHSGWNAVGIDLNPLGVFISNAKIVASHASPEELSSVTEGLTERLRARIGTLDPEREWSEPEKELLAGGKWTEALPNFDYLSAWFPRSVLAQIVAIISEINVSVPASMRAIFLVVASDILRDVSYQDPGDLRIRRRKNPHANYPAISIYLERLRRKIKAVTSAYNVIDPYDSEQAAFVGDSRLSLEWIKGRCPNMSPPLFDAAITSPPYATALPYIDTQRLSLCLLGLASSDNIMRLDRRMMGTREMLDSKRRELDSQINDAECVSLGKSATSLCKRMIETVSSSDGFRRRNMPALIYSYFQDMALALCNVKEMLKPSGIFALIVGSNRTILGGNSITIDTPRLLADTASSHGWEVAEIIELNTYQRYDVHQRNSIKTESLVLLKKPS